MKYLVLSAALFCASCVYAAPQDYRTTPVPILKQINRHNDDGSYSYGYEAADGTFKIETKYPTGEVFGKYGYIGDDGKVREIEYGASRRGFEPAGTGINVPPPTLTNNVGNSLDYDDGQYKEEPSVYYKKQSQQPVTNFKTQFSSPFIPTTARPQQYYQPQPQYQPNYYQHRPVSYDPNLFRGHPAANIDINTGSYSLSYSG